MTDQMQQYEQMTPLADTALMAGKLGVEPNDARMLLALDLASARFRGQTRNPISLTSETVTLDAHGTRSLLLPFMHIVSVDSLTIDGVDYGPDDFEWSEAGMIRLATPMPDLWRSVRISCTYGYADIPQDVQEVVMDQATAMYPMLAGNAYTAMTTGTESRSFNTQLQVGYSAQWSACVQRYRLAGAW
jgi:hypothetical protein